MKSLLKKAFFATGILVFVLTGCDSKQPEIKAAVTDTLNIEEWKTENGTRVLYVNAPELPMVDIQVVFDAGSIRDGEQPGIASLTNGMLSHGASLGDKSLNVDEITERFENIGARYGASASKDNAEVSLRTLTDEKWLDSAVETFRAVLNNPSFDQSELDRVRKQLLIGFESRKQSPRTISSELFYKNMYPGHPYALPTIGTEASVKAFTREDLVNFYKKYYVAKNALVTIVGAVDKDKAKQLAETIVGELPEGKEASELNKVDDLQQAKNVHYEYPSTQTHIMIGQPGLKRGDKDYFALYVGNHILGGSGFGSRIMSEIREKRGLAYSSYSYFVPLTRRGPFLLGMQTANEQTDEALKVMRETLQNFIEQGPTAQELEHARKNITGGFPLKIDSNSDISGYIAMIGFYKLPLTYLKDFNSNVEAVTLDDIRDAFKRRVQPEKMITVTVGKKQ